MYTVALSCVAATVLIGVVIAVCQWLMKRILLNIIIIISQQ